MKIYLASSWKNRHAVEMLTRFLRCGNHTVASFVENNHGEDTSKARGPQNLDEWIASAKGLQSFDYDTAGATKSDLVIYIGVSGCDAWAEVGAAWASHVKILGLLTKGEQVGLMRRMVSRWFEDFTDLLEAVDELQLAILTPSANGSPLSPNFRSQIINACPARAQSSINPSSTTQDSGLRTQHLENVPHGTIHARNPGDGQP